jgi:hypothetical protein
MQQRIHTELESAAESAELEAAVKVLTEFAKTSNMTIIQSEHEVLDTFRIPRLYCACTTLADRRARGTEDKAAGQCRYQR